jgi:hypothetical protein
MMDYRNAWNELKQEIATLRDRASVHNRRDAYANVLELMLTKEDETDLDAAGLSTD